MEPEDGPLEKEKHLQITNFLGFMMFHVCFPEGISKEKHPWKLDHDFKDQQITQLLAFPGLFCGVGTRCKISAFPRRCRQKTSSFLRPCVTGRIPAAMAAARMALKRWRCRKPWEQSGGEAVEQLTLVIFFWNMLAQLMVWVGGLGWLVVWDSNPGTPK